MESFHELVYADQEVQNLIAKQFPQAHFTDARDEIHWERFEVDILGVTQEEFFRWAIKEGIARLCLGIELSLRMGSPWVKTELEKMVKEKMNADSKDSD